MAQKRQDIIQIRQSFCQRDKSLSSFLKLGNLSVTFWNNIKRFNKTIQIWVQHILSVTALLVLTDILTYFVNSTFSRSQNFAFIMFMLSQRLLEIRLKVGFPLTSVGMGHITACIHDVNRHSITVR